MITPHEMEIQRDQLFEAARKKVLLMGILELAAGNGSERLDAALAEAERLQADGADIIDLGWAPIEPGTDAGSGAERLAHLVEVIETLAGADRCPVSVSTRVSRAARDACKAGAVIINDMSGLSDPEMAHVAAEVGAALVVTYNRGETRAMTETGSDMLAFFEEAFRTCDDAGVPGDRLILDPGVGFAKTYEQNFTVLGHVRRLAEYGCPVLVSVSRKPFISRLLNVEEDDRLIGTLAAGMNAMKRGASILRVHDVAAHRQAVTIWDSIDYAED